MYFFKGVFVLEFPEATLIRKSLTVRQMDIPPEVQLTKRSLLRWFALSIGLISEKESRAMVLNILDSLFFFLFSKKTNPSTKEIQAYMKEKFETVTSEKLIRYHLNKLIDLGLITRKKKLYHINPSPIGERDNIQQSFTYWVDRHYKDCFPNIESVLQKLSEIYV